MTQSPACPGCGGFSAGVTDSRGNDRFIRRRRRCECGERFTTAEVVYAARPGGYDVPPLDELAALVGACTDAEIRNLLDLARSPALPLLGSFVSRSPSEVEWAFRVAGAALDAALSKREAA